MTVLIQAGSTTLDAPAAAAYARALAAGAPDSVTSSFRDPEAQMRLYQGWIKRLPGYNFALHPAKSDHCKGLAIDLRGAEAKGWFRAHGASYGWIFTDKSEDWHIAYRSGYDQHINDVQEDEMDQETKDLLRSIDARLTRVESALATENNRSERTVASLTRVEKGLQPVKDVSARAVNEDWLNRVIASLSRLEKAGKGEQQ